MGEEASEPGSLKAKSVAMSNKHQSSQSFVQRMYFLPGCIYQIVGKYVKYIFDAMEMSPLSAPAASSSQ